MLTDVPRPAASYKPGGDLAKAAAALLALAGSLEGWAIVFAFATPDLIADETSLSSAIYSLIALARIGMLILTAIVFSIWWYRTRKNLIALGAMDLEYSPRAAVWSFYIPFLNLIRPANVAQETWKGSTPNLNDNTPHGRHQFENYRLITAWWACFVVGGGAERLAFKAKDPTALVVLLVISHLHHLTAAICGMLLVIRLTRRQHARYMLRSETQFAAPVTAT